jgi:hypothetical protein
MPTKGKLNKQVEDEKERENIYTLKYIIIQRVTPKLGAQA